MEHEIRDSLSPRPARPPAPPRPAPPVVRLLDLQALAGNRAVSQLVRRSSHAPAAVQRLVGFEYEVGAIGTERHDKAGGAWIPHGKGDVIARRDGYAVTADISGTASRTEFVTDQFDETTPAGRAAIVATARNIGSDMREINVAAKRTNPALASQVAGLGGGDRDRFGVNGRLDHLQQVGQLQMTGGVRVGALAAVLSGTAMPPTNTKRSAGTAYQDNAVAYWSGEIGGEPMQPLFRAAVVPALRLVGTRKTGGGVRGALASVLALMAQIPLNSRGLLATLGDRQGHFLARTDYAKILSTITAAGGITLGPKAFADALLATINSVPGARLGLGSDVFPASYSAAGQTLTGVTIGDWARGVVPTPGRLWGQWQGTDRITKRHFPGTDQQRAELRPFGGLGDKTDPGEKLILEWRNLRWIYPDSLEMMMKGLAEYLRKANG